MRQEVRDQVPEDVDAGATLNLKRSRRVLDLEDEQLLAEVRAGLFGGPAEPVRLDRYELGRRLGAGGIGVVFRARDPQLDREVAIKLIRPRATATADDDEHETRLVREARAMAQLSHPNVIQVYDVGRYALDENEATRDAELPRRGVFIVMELVDGETVARWLEREQRSLEDIVGVFEAAGRGLAAAHAQGLVHRDFKPKNVMIGRDHRVCVLDFGLSCAPTRVESTGGCAPDNENHASLTQTGAVMGTPCYMSPEQHDGLRVDARSDQYSFCVALHLALVGRPPFSAPDPDQLGLAKRGGLAAGALRGLPRQLAAVVSEGLAPDPRRRFADMNALLHAMSRPRRRARFVVLGALGMVAAAAWWLSRASQQNCDGEGALRQPWEDGDRDVVRSALTEVGKAGAAAWERSIARMDAYIEDWEATHRQTCTAPGQVDPAARQCLDRAAAQFAALVEQIDHADAAHAPNVETAVNRLPSVRACLEDDRALPQPSDPKLAAAVAHARQDIARSKATFDAGRMEMAIAISRASVNKAIDLGFDPLVAETQESLGQVLAGRGDFEEAAEALIPAVALAESQGYDRVAFSAAAVLVDVLGRQLGDADGAARYARIAQAALSRAELGPGPRANLEYRMALVAVHQGRFADGVARTDAALVAERERDEPDPQRLVAYLVVRADALSRLGRLDEAEAEFRRAVALATETFGATHPNAAVARRGVAFTRSRQGDYAGATQQLREAVAALEAGLGPDNFQTGAALSDLGSTLNQLGRGEEATEVLTRALKIFEATYGPDHMQTATVLNALGAAHQAAGRPDEAQRHLERALVVFEAQQPGAFGTGVIHQGLAVVAIDRGDYPRCRKHASRVIEVLLAAGYEATAEIANAYTSLAIADNGGGQPVEAVRHARQAIEIFESAVGRDAPQLSPALLALGQAYQAMDRAADAEPILRRAVAVATGDAGKRGEAELTLAEVLHALGQRAQAREYGEAAKRSFAAAGPRYERQRRAAEAWVSSRRSR